MDRIRGRRVRAALIASSALLLSATVMAPGSSAAPLCATPPDVFPVADLEAGMMATAWTVVEGTDPVSFDVEILGVLPDGIAPGVDFILVHVSGAVIDETGGIAFGFSGSPVYIGSELVGSIAYGFFGADQTFGGVTPAEDMVRLLEYPDGTGALSTAGATAAADSVRMPLRLREQAARTVHVAVSSIPSEAEQLRVPLAVSGLNGRGMKKISRTFRLGGLSVVPYRAGAASVTPLAATPLEAGDAVAGAVSVGDLTVAGVGTATATCDDLLLAFGHPFFWEGRAGAYPMAMYGAEVVQVIPDPSQVFGAFKIANLTDLHGIIDQDRLTGIRGVEGVEPVSVPVTTLVSNLDTATIREGETTVFRQDTESFPWLPDIAAFALLANEDVVFDRIGNGSSTVRFVLDGTGPDGEPFHLERNNMFFSEFDITFESIFEMYGFLYRIQESEFGDVTFSNVDAETSLTQEQLTAEIVGLRASSPLQPTLLERDRIRVRPGDTIRLEVALLAEGALEPDFVELLVEVPNARFGGSLVVQNGGADSCLFCFFDEDGEDEGPLTFNELLRELRRTPRNNDLVASLRVGSGKTAKDTFRADAVVVGSEELEVVIVR
jgi:SpoIVB peptidase S55